jgi:hypothetical protein
MSAGGSVGCRSVVEVKRIIVVEDDGAPSYISIAEVDQSWQKQTTAEARVRFSLMVWDWVRNPAEIHCLK